MSKFFLIFKHYIITSKFPFRVFAGFIIGLLGAITLVVTYKTCIEVWDFFKLRHMLDDKHVKYFFITVSFLIAIAAVVQSAPVIWSKISYWGQFVDNNLIKIFTHKKNFLDSGESILNKIREKIDDNHSKLQIIVINFFLHQTSQENIADIMNAIFNLRIDCQHVGRLLKANEAYDDISKDKKSNLVITLNNLGNQITDLLIYIVIIQNIIECK